LQGKTALGAVTGAFFLFGGFPVLSWARHKPALWLLWKLLPVLKQQPHPAAFCQPGLCLTILTSTRRPARRPRQL
jgi:hypothetical protein